MALSAGCDMLMACHSFTNQVENIQAVQMALESGVLSETQLRASAERISQMRQRCTSWSMALEPSGISGLSALAPCHSGLASDTYEASINVVRDTASVLPLRPAADKSHELLVLTPLVQPLSSGHAAQNEEGQGNHLEGELTFGEFGLLLAEQWEGKIVHASYAPSGIRPYHEDLISRAQVVIVVTADAGHNSY